VGEEASRVKLRRDAVVHYTRTRQLRPIDEFDLDVRLSAYRGSRPSPRLQPDTPACPGGGGPIEPGSALVVCTPHLPGGGGEDGGEGGGSEHTDCRPRTCHTCPSECPCATEGQQATCAGTCGELSCNCQLTPPHSAFCSHVICP
jgi:hypothetical protein